ncbi:unannotated protein [freshwater metagenome]|uniref:Unannotated protein n=1 Tax=freshwater metagenome TaxID=449393 RepID=A0A6J7JTC4_9ZZZZ|nr:hypothetical protein [Actinomycetota bacterium]
MSSPVPQPRTRVTRIAQEAVDKARLSVVPRVRTRAPRVPFVTLVSLVLVGGIVGLLLFNTSMQQASFTAAALETQADTLAGREQTLRMELDELRDPQRVAMQAQQMGMVIPPAPVFLDLETGKTSGVRTPATKDDAIQLVPPAPPMPAVLAPAPTVVEVPPPAAAPEPVLEEQAQATERRKKNRDR